MLVEIRSSKSAEALWYSAVSCATALSDTTIGAQSAQRNKSTLVGDPTPQKVKNCYEKFELLTIAKRRGCK